MVQTKSNNHKDMRVPPLAAQLLLSPKILLSFNPYAPFKEGDEALAEVLRNLEETQGIMDQVLQNQLHENYDMLRSRREEISQAADSALLRRLDPRYIKQVAQYSISAQGLRQKVTASAMVARSTHLWQRAMQADNETVSVASDDAQSEESAEIELDGDIELDDTAAALSVHIGGSDVVTV